MDGLVVKNYDEGITPQDVVITNNTGRNLGVSNVKRVGNVCYFHLFFNSANSAISGTLVTFPFKANGRADFVAYYADSNNANMGVQLCYMIDNTATLVLADNIVQANNFLAVSGCFVCKD